MKIKCNICRREVEVDELKFTPGETLEVECKHCGNYLEVKIPQRGEPESSDSAAPAPDVEEVSVLPSAAYPHEIVEDVIEETTASAPPKKKSSSHRNSKPKPQGVNTGKNVLPDNTPLPPPLHNNEQFQQVGTGSNPKRTPSQHRTPKQIPPPPPSKAGGSKSGSLIALCILLVVGAIGFFRMNSDDEQSQNDPQLVADSVVAEEVETELEYNVVDSDNNYEDEEDYEGDEGMGEMGEGTPFPGPTATGRTSSQAYGVYDEWISDVSLGDDWEATDFIKDKINREQVLHRLSASGSIKTNPVEFEAVQLKDKTIYGRYRNSNGTKLDVNGVEDEDGNLIIKLGHGSATSFWILHPQYHEDTSCAIQYSGTWGKSDADTELLCDFRQPSAIRRHIEVKGYVLENGNKYPFTLEYDREGNRLSNAKYVNSEYNTRVLMNTASLSNGRYKFTGNLGGEKFTIQYSATTPYRGTMTVGSRVADIEMNP